MLPGHDPVDRGPRCRADAGRRGAVGRGTRDRLAGDRRRGGAGPAAQPDRVADAGAGAGGALPAGRVVRRALRRAGLARRGRGVGGDLGVRAAVLLHDSGDPAAVPRRPTVVAAVAQGRGRRTRRGRAHHPVPDGLRRDRRPRAAGREPARDRRCPLAAVRHPGRLGPAVPRRDPTRGAVPVPADAAGPGRRAHPAPVAVPRWHRPGRRHRGRVRRRLRPVGAGDRSLRPAGRDRHRHAAARTVRRRADPQPDLGLRPADRLRGRGLRPGGRTSWTHSHRALAGACWWWRSRPWPPPPRATGCRRSWTGGCSGTATTRTPSSPTSVAGSPRPRNRSTACSGSSTGCARRCGCRTPRSPARASASRRARPSTAAGSWV